MKFQLRIIADGIIVFVIEMESGGINPDNIQIYQFKLTPESILEILKAVALQSDIRIEFHRR